PLAPPAPDCPATLPHAAFEKEADGDPQARVRKQRPRSIPPLASRGRGVAPSAANVPVPAECAAGRRNRRRPIPLLPFSVPARAYDNARSRSTRAGEGRARLSLCNIALPARRAGRLLRAIKELHLLSSLFF